MIKARKEVLKDGTVVWRARGVSVGKSPDGRRMQRTVSGPTKKSVEAEVARLTGAVADGSYLKPWDGSLNELLDSWLREADRGKEANTQLANRGALRIPRERLGRRAARSLTRDDISALVDYASGQGRSRGGAPGTGLSARSVQAMFAKLKAAFELACDDGKLPRNPCRGVKLPRITEREDTTWSEAQLQRFLGAAAADRLHACWLLSALGLRRGEVLGLRWGDIDWDAGTLTITRARVLVSGTGIVEKAPKSTRSARTLPLFEPVTSALAALQATQMEEQAAAGPVYRGGEYVASDEEGRPIDPDTYSVGFRRICRQNALPLIRLHDTRATTNSLLEQAGIPDSLRASWLGHTVQINRKSYLAKPKDMTPVSDMIGVIFGAV